MGMLAVEEDRVRGSQQRLTYTKDMSMDVLALFHRRYAIPHHRTSSAVPAAESVSLDEALSR
jgi:hypothetical protein